MSNELAENKTIEPKKSGNKLDHYAFLLKFSKPHILPVVFLVIFSICHSSIITVFAKLLEHLTFILPKKGDAVDAGSVQEILDGSFDLLYYGIPAAFGLFIFHGSITFLRKYISLHCSIDLRKLLCVHTLKLSLGFFDKRSSGDILSRSTNDLLKIEKSFEIFWGEFVSPATSILVLVPVIFWRSWQMALMSLVVIPLIIHLVRKASKKILAASRESLHHLGDVTETLREIYDTIKVIKVFKLEEISLKRFFKGLDDLARATLKAISAFALNSGLMEGITYMMIVILGFLSCYLTIKGSINLSLDVLLPVFLLLQEIYKKVKAFTKSFNSIQESFAAIDRVKELLNEKSDVVDAPDAIELDGISKGITLENVQFGYTDEVVIDGVNLKVKSGDTVALVGKSGSGKTTLFNLIARFYDVSGGSIKFDGTDIHNITHDSLLSNMALVTQEPILFNDSIANNIRFGRLDATEEEIRQAAVNANVFDFAMEFPDGLDHNVGERGSNLSGGQRQRVTIARAMLKNPPLLLLDEATSALDSESEQAVQKALEVLMKGRTTIVIAHRLSTIKNSTKIVVIEYGKVVEEGTHNQLLSAGNAYARLCKMQETGQTDA